MAVIIFATVFCKDDTDRGVLSPLTLREVGRQG